MSSPSRALPTTQNFNHYPINRSGVASNIDATPLYYPCIGLASTSPYCYALIRRYLDALTGVGASGNSPAPHRSKDTKGQMVISISRQG